VIATETPEGTTTRYVRFLGGFTGAWLVCDPDGAFYVRKAGADPDHARGGRLVKCVALR
jgi:hypothetical protein